MAEAGKEAAKRSGDGREVRYDCANERCKNKSSRRGDLCAACARDEEASDKYYALR